MTEALSLKVAPLLSFVLSQSGLPSALADFHPHETPTAFTTGSGDYQANQVYAQKWTLAGAAHQNFDLAGGGLSDALNNVVSWSNIKALLVVADPANGGNVVVGGAASNTWSGCFNDPTDKAVVYPDGFFFWVAPKSAPAVVPATGDILLVTNSSSSQPVTFTIYIIGGL